MGKIRMKTIGEDDVEKKQALDAQKRRDAKKAKQAEESEAMIEASAEVAPVTADDAESKDKKSDDKKSSKKNSSKHTHSHHTGKKYKAALKHAEPGKKLTLVEAVKLVKKMKYASFDETIEIHLNLKEGSIKGELNMPHGTGKEVKVAVVSDKLLKDIDGGTFDFDILIATPADMPKLIKYARILGPKGLMPNPKNGTVTEKTDEAVKKFQGGTVRYSTESKFPLMHQAVGKASFDDKQLVENIEAFVAAVKAKNIASAFISSTMSPSVEIEL